MRASSIAALVCLVGAVGRLVAQLCFASWVAVGAVLLAAGGAVVVMVRDRGTGQALFRYISALAVLSVLLLVLSARTLTA